MRPASWACWTRWRPIRSPQPNSPKPSASNAGPLRRILRGLVIEEVSVENADGTFELTELGLALARRSGPLHVRANLYYRAAGGLLDALRTGGTAFETVYGQPFFAYLDGDSDAQAGFEASMAGRAVAEARDVVAAYDFGPYRTVVDVGGGRGILLAAILGAVPPATGILLDRPAPVEQARTHLAGAGLCRPGPVRRRRLLRRGADGR